MPELPEVETIRLGLQKYLVGHTIESVKVNLSKMMQGDTRHIVGEKVIGVRRFGKGLVIDGNNGYSIAAHIKLTGQFIYSDPHVAKHVRLSQDKVGRVPNKWTHVIFTLDNHAVLYYNDLRQFGWIKIVKTEDVSSLPFFKDLGPEFPALPKTTRQQPLLTLDNFRTIVQKGSGPIKPLLMDQKKMSGIGNIYANDGLFDAGIDPRRKAKSLSEDQIKRLYESLLKVLKKGLEYRGATELNFVDALGEEGEYQKHFLVYSRAKKPCRVCGTPIQKFKLAGRGTYFCPACQR